MPLNSGYWPMEIMVSLLLGRLYRVPFFVSFPRVSKSFVAGKQVSLFAHRIRLAERSVIDPWCVQRTVCHDQSTSLRVD